MDFTPFQKKMESAGLGPLAIEAFRRHVELLASGASAMVPEATIRPAAELPSYDALPDAGGGSPLLRQTVFLKLNGGLGTGMGLEKAKSLLEVKAGHSFLDLIARQILFLRHGGDAPHALFMNSFSTSADTRSALAAYPELGEPGDLELLQNRVPKIDATTGTPAEHPGNPSHEWCPPGHGDLYVALAGSGKLEALLDAGIRFAFVSNSDNLGATLDGKILQHFAESAAPFLMEVTRRTASDRKGGHLCTDAVTGRFLLRESAQCPDEDSASFQDIDRHRYFNTNNLWINLEALRDTLQSHGGILPLPVIHNRKSIDPRDPESTPVIQLETAMGAAIGCFDDATALEVPRVRFAPVKTTSDLLALRSDAYSLTPDSRVILAGDRDGSPPVVDLDPDHYKLVDGLDDLTANACPSLTTCSRLTIHGPWRFSGPTTIDGDVTFNNPTPHSAPIPPGHYSHQTITPA